MFCFEWRTLVPPESPQNQWALAPEGMPERLFISLGMDCSDQCVQSSSIRHVPSAPPIRLALGFQRVDSCVIAVAIICVESTSAFSSQNTSSILRPILERWFGHIQDSSWDSTTTICARPATLSARAWGLHLSPARGCTRSTCRGSRHFAWVGWGSAGRPAGCAWRSNPPCLPSSRPPSLPVRRVPPVVLPTAPARPTMSCWTPARRLALCILVWPCAGAGGNPHRTQRPLELRSKHHRVEAVPLRKAEPLVEPHACSLLQSR